MHVSESDSDKGDHEQQPSFGDDDVVEADDIDDEDEDVAEGSVDLMGYSDGEDDDDGGSEQSEDRDIIADEDEDEDEGEDQYAHYEVDQLLDDKEDARRKAAAAEKANKLAKQGDKQYKQASQRIKKVAAQHAAAEEVNQKEREELFEDGGDGPDQQVKNAKPDVDRAKDRFWYRDGELPPEKDRPSRDPYFTFEEMAKMTTLDYGDDPDADVPTMAPFLHNVGRCPWATYLKQLHRFGLVDEFSRHYRLPFLAPSAPMYQTHVKYLAGRLAQLIVTPEKAERVLAAFQARLGLDVALLSFSNFRTSCSLTEFTWHTVP